jgi:hypothetical protein
MSKEGNESTPFFESWELPGSWTPIPVDTCELPLGSICPEWQIVSFTWLHASDCVKCHVLQTQPRGNAMVPDGSLSGDMGFRRG